MATIRICESDVRLALAEFKIPAVKFPAVIMSLDVDKIEAATVAGNDMESKLAVAREAIREDFLSKLFPIDIAHSIVSDLDTRLGKKTAASILKGALPEIDSVIGVRRNGFFSRFNQISVEAKIAMLISIAGFDSAIALLSSKFGSVITEINLWKVN
jgi:hypothetical protein